MDNHYECLNRLSLDLKKEIEKKLNKYNKENQKQSLLSFDAFSFGLLNIHDLKEHLFI